MVLLGLGTAALLVASFSGAQKAAMEANKLSEDDIHAAISGIWTSAFALGNFIGPTVSGFLVDAYGFEWTTIVFVGLYAFILIVDISELTFNVCRSKRTLHKGYEILSEEST